MWKFPPEWIPSIFEWKNYVTIFQVVPLGHYTLNTLTIELFVIIGQIVSCTLVAYGFARFKFRGREVLFMIMLATMLIPEQVTFIPLFLLFSKIGWVDTYLPLTVSAFFANPFFVFLMRQYLLTIPKDLDEAAKIDGGNSFQTLVKILIAILRPSIFIAQRAGAEWNLLMAASTLVLLPLLAIYYSAQRHLIGGMASMGLKG
jgi:multiple sugar transport system permease protein